MTSDGLGNQILITTSSDSAGGLTDADTTTVRITPRDYSQEEASVHSIDDNASENLSEENVEVTMIIGDGMAHEQEEGDVTDRYLIKESWEVNDKTNKSVMTQVCDV